MKKSSEMQERAKRCIPGMTQLLSKRPDRFSQGVWPGYFSKAEGAWIWDLDGNRYLDMSIGGIGATVLGYADPDVDGAVRQAIGSGVSSSLNCPEEVILAETLCEIHPWAEMVRYSRCGGEAMAMAVRIARAATGRDKVAFCGYHGWHDWYLAANLGTKNALGDHLIAGLDPAGVPKGLAGTAFPFHYNRTDELEAIVAEHGRDLAAIVMEPIRNDPPDPDFFPAVRRLADSVGAVVVIDEISAGLRFNSGGSHLVLFEEEPDIAVFSKALGNGYPIAAVIGRQSVMEAAQSTFISSTNWTDRIGPAAALATLEKHRRLDAGKHLVRIGELVQTGWSEIAARRGVPIEVGGIKPMSHFSFTSGDPLVTKAFFIQLMLDKGILASNLMYAMLAHTEEHVEQYLTACDEAFSVIAATGDIASQLRGEPSAAGFGRLT